jgi:hypothetical protein
MPKNHWSALTDSVQPAQSVRVSVHAALVLTEGAAGKEGM